MNVASCLFRLCTDTLFSSPHGVCCDATFWTKSPGYSSHVVRTRRVILGKDTNEFKDQSLVDNVEVVGRLRSTHWGGHMLSRKDQKNKNHVGIGRQSAETGGYYTGPLNEAG